MNSENNANKNNNISDNSTTNMNIEDDVTNEAIDIFNRKVDSNVSKLYDSYATILKLAQVRIYKRIDTRLELVSRFETIHVLYTHVCIFSVG